MLVPSSLLTIGTPLLVYPALGAFFNNSTNSLSAPGAPKELVELLKKAPRSGFTSKGVPIVKSDDGTNIYLGAADLRNDGESIHQAGGSGSGTVKQVSTVPLAIAKEALGLKGLSKEAKEFFEGIVQEAEKAQKAKLDTALKSLLAVGMSEEQAKQVLGL